MPAVRLDPWTDIVNVHWRSGPPPANPVPFIADWTASASTSPHSGTSLSAPLPPLSEEEIGDLLIMQAGAATAESPYPAVSIATPSGWTLLRHAQMKDMTHTEYLGTHALFWRAVDGSEPSSVSLSYAGADPVPKVSLTTLIKGADAALFPHAFAFADNWDIDSASHAFAPEVETTLPNCMIFKPCSLAARDANFFSHWLLPDTQIHVNELPASNGHTLFGYEREQIVPGTHAEEQLTQTIVQALNSVYSIAIAPPAAT